MRFEDFEDWGRALERDERLARAEAQIGDEQAALRWPRVGAALGYRCETEGCPSNPAWPASLCPNCRVVLALAATVIPPLPMLNPWTTSDGRYFASARDAALQQRWLDEKRASYVARVQRYLAQRLADRVVHRVEVTPDTYVEALMLMGDAWERSAYCRFRRVVEYVANVDIDRGENELARWFAGVRAWRAGSSADQLSIPPIPIRLATPRLIPAA